MTQASPLLIFLSGVGGCRQDHCSLRRRPGERREDSQGGTTIHPSPLAHVLMDFGLCLPAQVRSGTTVQ